MKTVNENQKVRAMAIRAFSPVNFQQVLYQELAGVLNSAALNGARRQDSRQSRSCFQLEDRDAELPEVLNENEHSYSSLLPPVLREVVILTVGAMWRGSLLIVEHQQIARLLGISELDIEELSSGKPTIHPDLCSRRKGGIYREERYRFGNLFRRSETLHRNALRHLDVDLIFCLLRHSCRLEYVCPQLLMSLQNASRRRRRQDA